MQITTNGRTITLNESQVDALGKFDAFFKSDKYFICLNGRAGTGKTTLCKEAIKKQRNICVTAPTHKAKKVIERASGYPSKTIHAILGLRPAMNLADFDKDNKLFAESGNNRMQDYSLIIIDESSMLTKEIVDLIKRTARNVDCKVVFMGDSNQMPPIKKNKDRFKSDVEDNISPVFLDKKIEQITLTIVERQAGGNPLLELYDKILSDISSEKVMFEEGISDLVDGKGYEFIAEKKRVQNVCLDLFGNDLLNTKILCYTNDRVRAWNDSIRSKILCTDERLVAGEILFSYETVSIQIGKTFENITENSCEYKVLGMKPASKKDKMNDNFFTLHGQDVTMQNIENDSDVKSVFVLGLDSYNDFLKIEHYHKSYVEKQKEGSDRARAWAIYFNFRNKYFLLGDIMDGKKKLVSKNFDYAYAITVHKSQGSTYKNVIVDLPDLHSNTDCKERNRLDYVALSRPTDAAYIYYRP